jgi:hypothetical protein
MRDFDRQAAVMGYTVNWTGLWPVLQRDGRDVYLPAV